MESWRYALASVVGTSHLESGTPCQDAARCEILEDGGGRDVLVALVADGAGSALHADEGATLACDRILNAIRGAFDDGATVADLGQAFVLNALANFLSTAREQAAVAGATLRDYACTSLGAVVGSEGALFWQIGDGAIVISDTNRGEYDWVFWPQVGQYANQTYFATDPDAASQIEVRAVAAQIDEVALFSDGLQRLALHFASQQAHTPFFRPVFQTVRPAPPGHARELSAALADYLASDRVSVQTDDDKTLVVATRRGVGATTVHGSDEVADAGV